MQLSAVSCVVSVLLLVGPSRSQAPGDADTICTVILAEQHPVYPSNVKVLMDSADYQNVISTDTTTPGPVWQTVDVDNIDSKAVRVSWTETESFGCLHQLEVCGFTDPNQDNWLITQHINRTLHGGDRLEQVEVSVDYQFVGCTSGLCSASFKVYKYDTSSINPTASGDVNNFGGMPVAVVAPTDQFGGVQKNTFSLTYSSTDTDSGFYLAIRDQNSCLTISRVLVFYYVCPAEARNLVQFEELLAPPNIPQNEAISVLAQCIPNASPVSQTGQVMVICDERGLWQVIPVSGCECDSGMQPNNKGSECIGCPAGQYITQNAQCMPCPNNSNTTYVNVEACLCLPTFFRAASDDPGRECTRSPSAPRNLVIIAGPTNTSITLSWSPPIEDGGRPEDIVTYGFHARLVGEVDIVTLGYVNETNGTAEGLFPFTDYNVFVSSENGVSSLDPDTLGRSASVRTTTQIGVPSIIRSDSITITSNVLSWAVPKYPGGVILHYDILFLSTNTSVMATPGSVAATVQVGPEETQYDVAGAKLPGGDYFVQIRAVTVTGAGNYSDPVDITFQRSPSAPRNLEIIAGPTNTSITLSWSPPIEDGGRPEDVITYGFHARPVGEVDIVTLGHVNETNGTAEGLFPFTDYDVYVSSENGVSSLDPDILGRSASVRTTTQIGVPSVVPDDSITIASNILSWEVPKYPGGVILHYDILFLFINTSMVAMVQVDPEETQYNTAGAQVPSGNYFVQIRAVTVTGAGSYSSPIPITILDITFGLGVSLAEMIGIALGIAAFLLMVIGVIFVCAFLCRRRGKSKTMNDIQLSDRKSSMAPRLLRGMSQIVKANKVISNSNIRLLDSIGEGEFGIVYKAHLIIDINGMPEMVAVKTMKHCYNTNDNSALIKESVRMMDLDHPNVLGLIGVCVDAGPSPYLVMPYMAQGSLLSYLKKHRPDLVFFEEAEQNEDKRSKVEKKLLDMCVQIAKGMEYLALHHLIHRDLAARNCMLDFDSVIKVADFGLTEEIYAQNYFRQGQESTMRFPIKWMAPESLRDNLFTEATDVWSFGVTCWEVYSGGCSPYPGIDPFTLHQQLAQGKRLNRPLNTACGSEVYDSMLACWKMDPTERPTFSQLVVFLSGILDQLAEYFDLNAENHTSGCGSTSIGIQEEQLKLNPSLTLEDQSDQPSENVSLPASAQHCASNENQEFVSNAITLPIEDGDA